MLRLSKDWANRSFESLVRDLIDLIAAPEFRTAVSRLLIWTCYDVLLRTRWRRDRATISIVESPRLVWQVNSARVAYYATVDDSSLDALTRERSGPCDVAIVPPRYGRVASAALRCRSPAPPSIRALDEFMGFRHLMTGMDMGWDRRETTQRLLQAYNRRAREEHDGEGLLVSLPPT